MRYDKRLIGIGIIMLLLVWIGNIAYYEEHTLKEPIFLKHYYDVKEGMQNIQLYYLDNINSKDKVYAISFPEVASNIIDVNEGNWNSDQRYYQMKRVDVTLYRGDTSEIPKEYRNEVITKAQVYFISGRVVTVDIGKMYLYCDEPSKDVLKMSMSSASSDNSTRVNFPIDKDITITGITSKFPELLKEILKPEINGKPLADINFPLKLNKGDNLNIDSSFQFDKKDIRRNYIYNFTIDVLAKDNEGKESYAPIYINYWLQSPKQYDIKELIKEGGSGKHV